MLVGNTKSAIPIVNFIQATRRLGQENVPVGRVNGGAGGPQQQRKRVKRGGDDRRWKPDKVIHTQVQSRHEEKGKTRRTRAQN